MVLHGKSTSSSSPFRRAAYFSPSGHTHGPTHRPCTYPRIPACLLRVWGMSARGKHMAPHPGCSVKLPDPGAQTFDEFIPILCKSALTLFSHMARIGLRGHRRQPPVWRNAIDTTTSQQPPARVRLLGVHGIYYICIYKPRSPFTTYTFVCNVMYNMQYLCTQDIEHQILPLCDGVK